MTTPTSSANPSGVTEQDAARVDVPGGGHAPAGDTTTRAHGVSDSADASTVTEVRTRANGAAAELAAAPHELASTSHAPASTSHREPAAASHFEAPAPRAHGLGHADRFHPNAEPGPGDRARTGGKRKRLLLLLPVLSIALGVATLLGYRYWYETTYFVSTDNASITGDLVQVGSLNAGRIVATRVDVGRPVRQGQEIAVVAMPQEVGGSGQGASPKMGVTGNADSLVPVYAPLNGIVAARMGHVGGTVTAGQPIYSLVDPSQVWVRANIEEASVWRVQVGQIAQIHVDALNRAFVGHVDAITPASAATFSLLPANNASGNFTKVTQYVPVKIIVDDARGVVLPLGTSVEVRIQIREPTSELPLPWQP